jgi:hypothetical protein
VYPWANEVFAGETAMLTRAACPTVAEVDDEVEPDVAVIVAVPSPALVASPFVPVLLLITKMVADDEPHVTSDVTSCVDPSV